MTDDTTTFSCQRKNRLITIGIMDSPYGKWEGGKHVEEEEKWVSGEFSFTGRK